MPTSIAETAAVTALPDAPDAADVAHVLRRTGFGPAPGAVEAAGGYDAALEAALAGAVDDGTDMPGGRRDDSDTAVAWWLRRLATATNALHDKLVLFWHSHLTSSADKANADMLVRQHNVLRRHALGNFRELLQSVAVDAAMLVFLDGAGSKADAPNENFARELMELFALGRGHYTQADVRALAVAAAGYTVDWDSEAVGFDEEAASARPLTLLGRSGRFDLASAIDVVCDDPACAPFVAGRLYRYFVGREPDNARRAELATTFAGSGLEIRPLVESILRGRDFRSSRWARARLPVEWFVAASLALGRPIGTEDIWDVAELGQLPFFPPSVAGWPVGPQWFGAGRQLVRAALVLGADVEAAGVVLEGATPADRAAAALARCGLFGVSGATSAALIRLAERVRGAGDGDLRLTMAALASPEASCC